MLIISWLKNHLVATALVLVAALALSIHLGHSRANAQTGFANDNNGAQDEKLAIQIGHRVAPPWINPTGLDPDLVGLGSYIVNVSGDCNGCHSAGPASEFVNPIGNPYLRQPPYDGTERDNPATYLGGGRDFGSFPAPPSPLHIISRNLTPDASGKPEGHTLQEFFTILRTGVDMDNRHPNCPPGETSDGTCMPFPFDGSKLQVMRWPFFRNLTDRQITAIYVYLSAVPCIQGHDPNETPNRCQ